MVGIRVRVGVGVGVKGTVGIAVSRGLSVQVGRGVLLGVGVRVSVGVPVDVRLAVLLGSRATLSTNLGVLNRRKTRRPPRLASRISRRRTISQVRFCRCGTGLFIVNWFFINLSKLLYGLPDLFWGRTLKGQASFPGWE
jgi:hypothetical protein